MTRRKAPLPTNPYGPNTEALRQQLAKALDKNILLEARVAALRSSLKRDPDRLLVELAQALLLAEEVSNPQQSHNMDPTGVKHSTDPPTPGASTAAQRRAAKHFRGELEKALIGFEAARRRNWQTPDRIPKVRCRNRHCPRLDHRVPAWDYRGKANEFCPGCGGRYLVDEEVTV